jgi:hypothetical protein
LPFNHIHAKSANQFFAELRSFNHLSHCQIAGGESLSEHWNLHDLTATVKIAVDH